MANAAQKKWMRTITEWYECSGFSDNMLNEYQFQLHHCTGRKSKHNKIAIGEWFILPLPLLLHDVNSNSALNITHFRHRFTDEFGLQSELFKEMIDSMVKNGTTLPFGQDVIDSIMDTKK